MTCRSYVQPYNLESCREILPLVRNDLPSTMASKKLKLPTKAHLSFKSKNKEKRQSLHINRKKATDSIKRDERFRRRRDEDKNPTLREQRLKQNVPLTLEGKRVWDDVDSDIGDGLGLSVSVERLKRRKIKEEQLVLEEEDGEEGKEKSDSENEERDSMIDSASEDVAVDDAKHSKAPKKRTLTERATSPNHSTRSTNLDFTPEALAAKFPTLFSSDAPPVPKVLITTSLNSTLHKEADHLTSLFPHSVYIPRSSHRYSHKFSVREICSFATKYVLHCGTLLFHLAPQFEFSTFFESNLPTNLIIRLLFPSQRSTTDLSKPKPQIHRRHRPQRRPENPNRPNSRAPPLWANLPLQHLKLDRRQASTRPRKPHRTHPRTHTQRLLHPLGTTSRASNAHTISRSARAAREAGSHATQPARLHIRTAASLRVP